MARKRSFDWDEAKRLRDEEGMTYRAIAERFGVSRTAIEHACKPDLYRRAKLRSARWTSENARRSCRGGCGRYVWTNNPGRSGYCRTCYAREVVCADSVRPGLLLCLGCDEWKPDAEFSLDSDSVSRRGRRMHCTACDTEQKKSWRRRRMVPCRACGKMKPPHEGSSRRDTGLCVSCYRDSLRGLGATANVG